MKILMTILAALGLTAGAAGEGAWPAMPPHVQIAEVLVLATHQANGTVIVRK